MSSTKRVVCAILSSFLNSAAELSAVPPPSLDSRVAVGEHGQSAFEEADAILLDGVAARMGGEVYNNTGADNCNGVTIIPLTLGMPGVPDEFIINGNNTGTTGPDCSSTTTIPIWWEAFEVPACADIVVSFCGTMPVIPSLISILQPTCPASGTNCGSPTFASSLGIGAPVCTDSNRWAIYRGLAPGVYYYSIRSDQFQGAYQMHVQATSCLGACCDFSVGGCTATWAADCAGPDQQFTPAGSCCGAECLPPGETYASSGVELLSHMWSNQFTPNPGLGNDVWGYASPSGREYAIIGLEAGTGFAEVTDPFNPVPIGLIPHFAVVWRDMKTYGTYAYSVNDSNGGGMDVIDLSQIDDGVVTLSSVLTDSGLQTSHNVAVNEDSAHLFLCGSNLGGGGLVSIDVSDPPNPVIDGAWTVTYVHDALVVTFHDGPYAGREIGFLFGTGLVFYVVDVTDKANMFTMGTLPFIPTSFGHQGWITEDRRYVIFADEGRMGISTFYVINVEDLNNPFFVNSFTNGLCTIEHNLMIRGRFSYHADYTSGLRVFDVFDPPNATEVAFFDTHPEGQAFAFDGAWGIYTGLPSGVVLISDMNRGLFVLNHDCNDNGIDDTLDIANLTSDDCNGNGLPDECERDANDDGTPDSCEFAGQPGPGPEPGGVSKNRFISMLIPAPTAATESAIRVRLDSLHHPPAPANAPDFSTFEGQYRYVNTFRDEQNNPVFDCPDSINLGTGYKCAVLGCEPEYRDWHAALAGAVLHVTGDTVIPSSQYSADFISPDCQGNEADCTLATPAVSLATGRWGDVDPGTVDVLDVSTQVDKLKDLPQAPAEPRTMLQPIVPTPRTSSVNILDVASAVDALKGFAYPFSTPETCP